MSTLQVISQTAWGGQIPEEMQGKIAVTWGARAIYSGQKIDLLPDRQSCQVAGFSEDDGDETSVEYKNYIARRNPFVRWVNKVGLPFLRKQAKSLGTEENRTVEMTDGKFHIEANPQGSYGYLYIRAWETF